MMTAMMTDRSNRLQIKSGDSRNHIKSSQTLNAHRLQGERIVQSADKAVGSDADADRCPAGNADITAGQRARPKARSRREHDPTQGNIIGEADLRSKAADCATIVLQRRTRSWSEDTIEYACRYDNKACRPRASAIQTARLDIGVSGRRCRQGKTKKRSDKGTANNESHRHGSPFIGILSDPSSRIEVAVPSHATRDSRMFLSTGRVCQ